MEVTLQNIRSIVRKQTIPIAPLTILVGENSSGKSTFLATVSVLCDPSGYPFSPKFNEPPYKLGSYDTIATYKGGKYGRAKFFVIGHRSPGAGNELTEVLSNYTSRRGQIELSKLSVKSFAGELELALPENDSSKYNGKLWSKKTDQRINFEISREATTTGRADLTSLVIRSIAGSRNPDLPVLTVEIIQALTEISGAINPARSLSIAPIRTKPNRTYDQILEDYDPEGTHIPYVLAKMLSRESPTEDKDRLLRGLKRFGEESGLFDRIGVKELGTKIGDPFQIMVTPSGRAANLLDVGYGVSQALPVVVQTILVDRPQILLLQQPEVHLHPKAQAALGSFFVRQVTESQKRFIIETHSDFIIDRIRQEIAAGRLNPNFVSILFFRKKQFETTIHELSLDSLGNIIGAPPSYREFFLREELSLFKKTGGAG